MRPWTIIPPVMFLALVTGEGLAFAADEWVGTWAASPQSSSTTFNQQTLRQIVHTTLSGSPARVQLSNAFGTQAVTIADVHIAERDSGSSVVASTDQAVTFGGQSSTTIAVGDVAISDSVNFTVKALTDVAISIYLPQPTGPATSHSLGLQTNYVVSGDVSGSTTLTNPATNQSYYFLANVDVVNSAAAGAVATLGASITDGYQSSADQNVRWPNDLATRLVGATMTVGVLNQGISGNQLLVDGSGQSALHRFSRDVLSQPGVKWVIFSDDPINDLGDNNPPPTSAQLIAGITQLITSAHQNGIRFLCSTLTPYQGASYWTAQGETEREAINTFIRGPSSGCDGIVDQDNATHNPAMPTEYLPAYDSGDHLHPNNAGYQAIANAVNLAFFDAGAPTGDAGFIMDAGPGSGTADGGSERDAASGTADAGSEKDATSGTTDAGSGADAASGTADAGPGKDAASGTAKEAGLGGASSDAGEEPHSGGGGCSMAPGAGVDCARPTGVWAGIGVGLMLVWKRRRNRDGARRDADLT